VLSPTATRRLTIVATAVLGRTAAAGAACDAMLEPRGPGAVDPARPNLGEATRLSRRNCCLGWGVAQVARLWALTTSEAQAAVRSLVARGLLTLDARGRVCRSIDRLP